MLLRSKFNLFSFGGDSRHTLNMLALLLQRRSITHGQIFNFDFMFSFFSFLQLRCVLFFFCFWGCRQRSRTIYPDQLFFPVRVRTSLKDYLAACSPLLFFCVKLSLRHFLRLKKLYFSGKK